jgi:hypothetical protein
VPQTAVPDQNAPGGQVAVPPPGGGDTAGRWT